LIPLSWYLIFAALMFTTGLFGVLTRKNAVAILMGIELMLNAVNVNLLAFWRYLWAPKVDGQVFVAIVLVAAAAEAVVGLALIISAYRRRNTVVAEEMDIILGRIDDHFRSSGAKRGVECKSVYFHDQLAADCKKLAGNRRTGRSGHGSDPVLCLLDCVDDFYLQRGVP
jgi:NADH:ubiquinone oxidoreductase subunit K